MRLAWALAVAVLGAAACGDSDDPCDGAAATCVTVRVSSSTVDAIDHLELDVVYGDLHGTTTTQAPGGAITSLPLTTAIELDVATRPVRVAVVAAGKLAGAVLGTGAASTTVEGQGRASLEIRLGAVGDCVAGGHYCGGDTLAGDPATVYECNRGGAPIARGVCAFGCRVQPTEDDVCIGGGGACVEGGEYCGGDKLDGDPQTLYRCQGGDGVPVRECPDGCVQRPGSDDACR